MGKDIESMSFEEAIAELEKIVTKMDGNQETLDSAIQDFERGVKLKQHCEEKLQLAQLKVEKIVKKSDQYETENIDIK